MQRYPPHMHTIKYKRKQRIDVFLWIVEQHANIQFNFLSTCLYTLSTTNVSATWREDDIYVKQKQK